jgi:hypothetical protein
LARQSGTPNQALAADLLVRVVHAVAALEVDHRVERQATHDGHVLVMAADQLRASGVR